jgi:hypothetical protein
MDFPQCDPAAALRGAFPPLAALSFILSFVQPSVLEFVLLSVLPFDVSFVPLLDRSEKRSIESSRPRDIFDI